MFVVSESPTIAVNLVALFEAAAFAFERNLGKAA